jgi:hypothetical protein
MPVTIDDLSAPTSGQFFRLDAPLTNPQVTAVFNEVVVSATGPEEERDLRAQRILGNVDYWSSFLCFPVEGPPAFLPQTALQEKRFAFLLVIELQYHQKWFVGVFKSGVSGIGETLEKLCAPINRRALAKAFGADARYEKLSLRRMTISQHELRGSSYEAADLATTLPLLAITRSVPRLLRLRHKSKGGISIRVGTSRIHKTGVRTGISNLARFVLDVARETERGTRNEFLDAFPTDIEFEKKPKTLNPSGVLFDWWPLLQNPRLELKWTTKTGKALTINSKRFLNAVGGVLITRRHLATWILRTEESITIGTLRENQRGYAISDLLDHKVRVANTETNEEKPLTTWVREQQAFQIAFSSPEYFFSGGHLYKRAGFDREVGLVGSIIQSNPALGTVDSEKGKPAPSSPADVQFPPNSIFRFIEDVHLVGSDFLWCTDLGDEWADYVALRNHSIIFAHCKHGKQTLGATPYQEVVGQALKNLGRVQATPQVFVKKIKAAAAKNTWGTTGIVRLRDNKLWPDFETVALQRLSDPDAPREVRLVISMLSLAAYKAAAAAKRKRPNFIQLVWLLASFMNSTREFGGKPIIVCAP